MPGRARLSLPGGPWHIIQRGNKQTLKHQDGFCGSGESASLF